MFIKVLPGGSHRVSNGGRLFLARPPDVRAPGKPDVVVRLRPGVRCDAMSPNSWEITNERTNFYCF